MDSVCDLIGKLRLPNAKILRIHEGFGIMFLAIVLTQNSGSIISVVQSVVLDVIYEGILN